MNKDLLRELYEEVSVYGKKIKFSMNKRFFEELEETEFIKTITVINTGKCEIIVDLEGKATLSTTYSNQEITIEFLLEINLLNSIVVNYNLKRNSL